MNYLTPLLRRHLLPLLLTLPFSAQAASGDPADSGAVTPPSAVANAVVKVFATARAPDPFKPWTKQAPSESTGSGVVVEGGRILTNAHVVRYASQIQIQLNQAGEKLTASVFATAPGIDLALLQLDDAAALKAYTPLPRANALPAIKDAVLAYGYPTGGASLSITKGIVSRIEYVSYSSQVRGLRIQVDAAINPGNSGGPVVVGEKMIGLAFSVLNGTQNISYIIPNEEIEMFLSDIADGRYDGKPHMHDELQTLENTALRSFLKLDKGVKGIVVNRPYATDPSYPLKQWDVITHVGDTAVDEEGMVKVGPDLRLRLDYLVPKLARNGLLPMTVLRAGKSVAIKLPVRTQRPLLIPSLDGGYPPYFVYGPVVFSRATMEFSAFLQRDANVISAFSFMRSPLLTQRTDAPDATRDELVVISSPLFPHKLATGYSNPTANVVQAVNGTPVRSLKHLVALLRDMKEEFVTLEIDRRGGETMVFAHKDMLASVEGILNDNGVRSQGSPDMMEVWKGKP